MLPPWLTSLLTAGGALIAVLALILLAGRLARSGGLGAPRTGRARSLTILETTSLDSRRRLHLVACDGRRVVLLTGGGSDLLVGWLDGPETG
jgi:flagellar biogenesis protein FliO